MKSSFDETTSTKDGGTEVHIAELNVPLTIGEEIKSFEVRLGDSLFGTSGLGMARVDDYDLTFLSGTLTFPPVIVATGDQTSAPATIVPTLEKSVLQQQLPLIHFDGTNSTGAHLNPLKPTLFIGSLVLTSLKSKLQSLQPPILSTFSSSGALICSTGEQVVLVKKDTSVAGKENEVQGRLVIEGGIGELFWRVRKQVYSMGAMAG